MVILSASEESVCRHSIQIKTVALHDRTLGLAKFWYAASRKWSNAVSGHPCRADTYPPGPFDSMENTAPPEFNLPIAA
jgi:hypothetical protein